MFFARNFHQSRLTVEITRAFPRALHHGLMQLVPGVFSTLKSNDDYFNTQNQIGISFFTNIVFVI